MIIKVVIIILFYFNLLKAQTTKAAVDSINNLPATAYLSNLFKSKKIYEDNLEMAKNIGYKLGEAKALNRLSIIHYLLGDYDKSTEYNIQAIKIFEGEKKYEDLADAYGELGYQMKRRDLIKADEYMQKALQISESHKIDKVILAKLYDNYGVIKELEGKIDSALIFYNKSFKIKQQLKDTVGIPFSLNKIANAKALQRKFNEAYFYLRISDKYREKETSDYGRADNLTYRADFLSMENKIDSAIVIYDSALDLSLKNGYTFLVLYIYQQLSDLLSKKQDFYNALQYFKKYTTYKDSLLNIETNQKIAELEIAFETAEKDKLIAQKDLLLKQRAILFLIIGTLLVFLTLTMFGLYAYQIQKRKAIALEAELVKQKAIDEQNKRIYEEKLKISRELHDNIGSHLTFIINSLDNLKYALPDGNIKDIVKRVNDFSRLTLNELRSTIWAMKNESGELDLLITKIKDFINRANVPQEKLRIEIRENTTKNYTLSSVQLLNLFRICQESLQNIIKHSDANKCLIIFDDWENGFIMQISDNGKGIEDSNSLESSGLASMKLRATEANAKINIIKSDIDGRNCGTNLSFQVTCQNSK